MPPVEEAPQLRAARQEIEQIDRAIVLLVAARLTAAGAAIRIRRARDGRISDPVQEQLVLARAHAWAEQADVPAWLVETMFRGVLRAGKERFVAQRTGPFARETDSRNRDGRSLESGRSTVIPLAEPRLRSAVRKP